MRIACLQHVSFEGPGKIAGWARECGHSLRTIHLYNRETLPSLSDFDLLLIMGGPMSVNDEPAYPWLAAEKKLIRQCLGGGAGTRRFVLGICLGAQLIANALGARVYRNRVKEIGWFPVRLRPEAAQSCFENLPEELDVFHWHGETFDLPPECVHLASSEACELQAFEHPSGLALQFHPEIEAQGICDLVRHCAGDIGSGPFEQPAAEIVAAEPLRSGKAGAALYTMLDAVAVRVMMNRLIARFRQKSANCRTPEELQQFIVDAIAHDLAYYDWTGFYMLDHADPGTLLLGPFAGEPTPHVRIPITEGICGAAATNGETVIVDDVAADAHYLPCSARTRSEIVVPIFAGGNVVGEIDIDSHTPAAFRAADRRFLDEVAALVGSFIESQKGEGGRV